MRDLYLYEMHDIEPYYKWRNYYVASEDERSPFFGRQYDEFTFRNKIYNYFIHPQWDFFGSPTLYAKSLFVDYDDNYAIIELIGEWNDAISNDSMFIKRHFVDAFIAQGINKFILMCDNVLNFHGSDNSYYEEWWDDVKDDGGWICIVNTLDHVLTEMENARLQYYCNLGPNLNDINWRVKSPKQAYNQIFGILNSSIKQLNY